MESFQGYLIGQGDTHNTVSNIIQKFKSFLNHAAKNGHNKNIRYKDYKISWKKGEVIYLTWEELLAFYKTPMPTITLEQVRDVFSFACFSGMRYGDLRNLTKDSVHEGYIRYNMAKTRQQLNHTIPLNDYSKEILAKYKNYPGKRALPVISNQKMNDYLKDVGKVAGLDYPITVVRIRGSERIVITKPKHEWLTSHVGRKTFITNALQKGIIAEVVMGISGHADTKSFRHYFTISEEHKSREMSRHFSKEAVEEEPIDLCQD
jgi:integrase